MPKWLQGLLMLALVAGASVLLLLGWTYSGSLLLVDVDGHRYEVRTHATTVGEALRHVGLELHPEDLVSPGLDTQLQPELAVRVRRACLVALDADGQVRQYRTQATTIGEFLTDAGVELGPSDEIWLGDHLVELDRPLDSQLPQPQQLGHRSGLASTTDGDASDPPQIRVRRAHTLTLDDDGVATTLHTTLTTVGQVLQENGVLLFLGDEVTPGLQDQITPGMKVTIDRSVPVGIEVDGHAIRTRTRAETVAGALGQEGIALIGKDRVEPGLAAPVLPDITIRVTRVREEFEVEFEPIPFETVWATDPQVEIDSIRLVQDGQIGLTKRRYRVVYENGQEVDRVLEDVWAAQPAIDKTMAYGTKIVVRTMDTPDGPIEYWRKMRVYTTSYTAASAGKPKSHPRYGYTRLGWFLTKGIVAVDPTVIPLKTRMYVPGYGVARALDTGGGVKGKFVDLGFDDHNYQSWHWWTDIYLLTPVPPANKIRWVLPELPRFPDRNRH
jgi:uncharacterized protein YabE (DUF348 family)